MNDFTKKRTWGPTPKYPLVEAYKRPNNDFIVIAGPCSVESEDHIKRMAEIVAKAGATHLRGGVFRAGTYPGNNFGWIPKPIIKAYHEAAKNNGLKNIVEILEYSDQTMEQLYLYADCYQVGARAQQHYQLLRSISRDEKPIFLKRNTGCTVDEWLGSAEHLLRSGQANEIFLIERGSSTFHNDVRWTPTPHVIPSIKAICNIPVIMDASHSTGRRDLVPSMALAGVAAGASGILVEVHDNPDKSLSDAEQAIDPITFEQLMKKVNSVRRAINE
ncbi:MAG TPA: hypothetical protein VK141_03890 [Nitrosomonas sp.]|nr:hypothetical protein [Nitrosomonas sp.]